MCRRTCPRAANAPVSVTDRRRTDLPSIRSLTLAAGISAREPLRVRPSAPASQRSTPLLVAAKPTAVPHVHLFPQPHPMCFRLTEPHVP